MAQVPWWIYGPGFGYNIRQVMLKAVADCIYGVQFEGQSGDPHLHTAGAEVWPEPPFCRPLLPWSRAAAQLFQRQGKRWGQRASLAVAPAPVAGHLSSCLPKGSVTLKKTPGSQRTVQRNLLSQGFGTQAPAFPFHLKPTPSTQQVSV